MKKTIAIVAFTSLLGVGCARQPENVAAADIGSDTYQTFSCDQLYSEKVKMFSAIETLSSKQRSAASGDAWGVFLLGLPISSISGNDQESALAVAKGKFQALSEQQALRRCPADDLKITDAVGD